MKAIGIISVFLLAVFLVFATIGAPEVGYDGESFWFSPTDSSGPNQWNGNPGGVTTIFQYWAMAEQETTKRLETQQYQATERLRIEEAAATERNREFWQMFPLTILAVALCIVAGAAVAFALRWEPDRVPKQITINNYAPAELQQYASGLGLPDAEYVRQDGRWLVVDPVAQRRYEPPSYIALLPERRL